MSAKSKLVILKKKEIEHKITRLACQILEQHTATKELQFVGLNSRGFRLSKEIKKQIAKLDVEKQISLFQGITEERIEILNKDKLNSKHPIIIMDDVLNTGRSIYFLLADLASIAPKAIQICVLADRQHKKFPIHADFVGLTFATTIQEHIFFNVEKLELYLE